MDNEALTLLRDMKEALIGVGIGRHRGQWWCNECGVCIDDGDGHRLHCKVGNVLARYNAMKTSPTTA